ncbi:uncharacterized protein TA20620 [Theileria annulata]|uniref:Uncharacterized protein n=1 Tax=Theileria annulata TaxID=5874 RepID=Q4UH33_THEAN|nr:uncharacterized protein TA20620 [Theileria annulata]CAI73606.1 hypothetical protein TA20620 [Theileria annulata]|eukprot:XP_954283.1 hypothetical protein TA20620 [Theileria annulata]
MFEDKIIQLLNNVFDSYIEGIDQSKLAQMNLLGGKIVLNGLHLRPDIFDILELPFHLTFGFLGSVVIKIQIPIISLSRKNLSLDISDLLLLMTTKPESQWDPEEYRDEYLSTKIAILSAESLELLVNQLEGQGFMWNTVLSFLDTLEVTIHNIHFRVEDYTTNNNVAYAFGMVVKNAFFKLNLDNSNEIDIDFPFQSLFTNDGKLPQSIKHRTIDLEGFGMYIDQLDPLSHLKHAAKNIETINLNDIECDINETENDEHNKNESYLIRLSKTFKRNRRRTYFSKLFNRSSESFSEYRDKFEKYQDNSGKEKVRKVIKHTNHVYTKLFSSVLDYLVTTKHSINCSQFEEVELDQDNFNNTVWDKSNNVQYNTSIPNKYMRTIRKSRTPNATDKVNLLKKRKKTFGRSSFKPYRSDQDFFITNFLKNGSGLESTGKSGKETSDNKRKVIVSNSWRIHLSKFCKIREKDEKSTKSSSEMINNALRRRSQNAYFDPNFSAFDDVDEGSKTQDSKPNDKESSTVNPNEDNLEVEEILLGLEKRLELLSNQPTPKENNDPSKLKIKDESTKTSENGVEAPKVVKMESLRSSTNLESLTDEGHESEVEELIDNDYSEEELTESEYSDGDGDEDEEYEHSEEEEEVVESETDDNEVQTPERTINFESKVIETERNLDTPTTVDTSSNFDDPFLYDNEEWTCITYVLKSGHKEQIDLFIEGLKGLEHNYILNTRDFKGLGSFFFCTYPVLPTKKYTSSLSEWGSKYGRASTVKNEYLPMCTVFLVFEDVNIIMSKEQIECVFNLINHNVFKFTYWISGIAYSFEDPRASPENEQLYMEYWPQFLLSNPNEENPYEIKEEENKTNRSSAIEQILYREDSTLTTDRTNKVLTGKALSLFISDFEILHSYQAIRVLRSRATYGLSKLISGYTKSSLFRKLGTNINECITNAFFANICSSFNTVDSSKSGQTKSKIRERLKFVEGMYEIVSKQVIHGEMINSLKKISTQHTFTVDLAVDVLFINSRIIVTNNMHTSSDKTNVKGYILSASGLHIFYQDTFGRDGSQFIEFEVSPFTVFSLEISVKDVNDYITGPTELEGVITNEDDSYESKCICDILTGTPCILLTCGDCNVEPLKRGKKNIISLFLGDEDQKNFLPPVFYMSVDYEHFRLPETSDIRFRFHMDSDLFMHFPIIDELNHILRIYKYNMDRYSSTCPIIIDDKVRRQEYLSKEDSVVYELVDLGIEYQRIILEGSVSYLNYDFNIDIDKGIFLMFDVNLRGSYFTYSVSLDVLTVKTITRSIVNQISRNSSIYTTESSDTNSLDTEGSVYSDTVHDGNCLNNGFNMLRSKKTYYFGPSPQVDYYKNFKDNENFRECNPGYEQNNQNDYDTLNYNTLNNYISLYSNNYAEELEQDGYDLHFCSISGFKVDCLNSVIILNERSVYMGKKCSISLNNYLKSVLRIKTKYLDKIGNMRGFMKYFENKVNILKIDRDVKLVVKTLTNLVPQNNPNLIASLDIGSIYISLRDVDMVGLICSLSDYKQIILKYAIKLDVVSEQDIKSNDRNYKKFVNKYHNNNYIKKLKAKKSDADYFEDVMLNAYYNWNLLQESQMSKRTKGFIKYEIKMNFLNLTFKRLITFNTKNSYYKTSESGKYSRKGSSRETQDEVGNEKESSVSTSRDSTNKIMSTSYSTREGDTFLDFSKMEDYVKFYGISTPLFSIKLTGFGFKVGFLDTKIERICSYIGSMEVEDQSNCVPLYMSTLFSGGNTTMMWSWLKVKRQYDEFKSSLRMSRNAMNRRSNTVSETVYNYYKRVQRYINATMDFDAHSHNHIYNVDDQENLERIMDELTNIKKNKKQLSQVDLEEMYLFDTKSCTTTKSHLTGTASFSCSASDIAETSVSKIIEEYKDDYEDPGDNECDEEGAESGESKKDGSILNYEPLKLFFGGCPCFVSLSLISGTTRNCSIYVSSSIVTLPLEIMESITTYLNSIHAYIKDNISKNKPNETRHNVSKDRYYTDYTDNLSSSTSTDDSYTTENSGSSSSSSSSTSSSGTTSVTGSVNVEEDDETIVDQPTYSSNYPDTTSKQKSATQHNKFYEPQIHSEKTFSFHIHVGISSLNLFTESAWTGYGYFLKYLYHKTVNLGPQDSVKRSELKKPNIRMKTMASSSKSSMDSNKSSVDSNKSSSEARKIKDKTSVRWAFVRNIIHDKNRKAYMIYPITLNITGQGSLYLTHTRVSLPKQENKESEDQSPNVYRNAKFDLYCKNSIDKLFEGWSRFMPCVFEVKLMSRNVSIKITREASGVILTPSGYTLCDVYLDLSNEFRINRAKFIKFIKMSLISDKKYQPLLNLAKNSLFDITNLNTSKIIDPFRSTLTMVFYLYGNNRNMWSNQIMPQSVSVHLKLEPLNIVVNCVDMLCLIDLFALLLSLINLYEHQYTLVLHASDKFLSLCNEDENNREKIRITSLFSTSSQIQLQLEAVSDQSEGMERDMSRKTSGYDRNSPLSSKESWTNFRSISSNQTHSRTSDYDFDTQFDFDLLNSYNFKKSRAPRSNISSDLPPDSLNSDYNIRRHSTSIDVRRDSTNVDDESYGSNTIMRQTSSIEIHRSFSSGSQGRTNSLNYRPTSVSDSYYDCKEDYEKYQKYLEKDELMSSTSEYDDHDDQGILIRLLSTVSIGLSVELELINFELSSDVNTSMKHVFALTLEDTGLWLWINNIFDCEYLEARSRLPTLNLGYQDTRRGIWFNDPLLNKVDNFQNVGEIERENNSYLEQFSGILRGGVLEISTSSLSHAMRKSATNLITDTHIIVQHSQDATTSYQGGSSTELPEGTTTRVSSVNTSFEVKDRNSVSSNKGMLKPSCPPGTISSDNSMREPLVLTKKDSRRKNVKYSIKSRSNLEEKPENLIGVSDEEEPHKIGLGDILHVDEVIDVEKIPSISSFNKLLSPEEEEEEFDGEDREIGHFFRENVKNFVQFRFKTSATFDLCKDGNREMAVETFTVSLAGYKPSLACKLFSRLESSWINVNVTLNAAECYFGLLSYFTVMLKLKQMLLQYSIDESKLLDSVTKYTIHDYVPKISSKFDTSTINLIEHTIKQSKEFSEYTLKLSREYTASKLRDYSDSLSRMSKDSSDGILSEFYDNKIILDKLSMDLRLSKMFIDSRLSNLTSAFEPENLADLYCLPISTMTTLENLTKYLIYRYFNGLLQPSGVIDVNSVISNLLKTISDINFYGIKRVEPLYFSHFKLDQDAGQKQSNKQTDQMDEFDKITANNDIYNVQIEHNVVHVGRLGHSNVFGSPSTENVSSFYNDLGIPILLAIKSNMIQTSNSEGLPEMKRNVSSTAIDKEMENLTGEDTYSWVLLGPGKSICLPTSHYGVLEPFLIRVQIDNKYYEISSTQLDFNDNNTQIMFKLILNPLITENDHLVDENDSPNVDEDGSAQELNPTEPGKNDVIYANGYKKIGFGNILKDYFKRIAGIKDTEFTFHYAYLMVRVSQKMSLGTSITINSSINIYLSSGISVVNKSMQNLVIFPTVKPPNNKIAYRDQILKIEVEKPQIPEKQIEKSYFRHKKFHETDKIFKPISALTDHKLVKIILPSPVCADEHNSGDKVVVQEHESKRQTNDQYIILRGNVSEVSRVFIPLTWILYGNNTICVSLLSDFDNNYGNMEMDSASPSEAGFDKFSGDSGIYCDVLLSKEASLHIISSFEGQRIKVPVPGFQPTLHLGQSLIISGDSSSGNNPTVVDDHSSRTTSNPFIRLAQLSVEPVEQNVVTEAKPVKEYEEFPLVLSSTLTEFTTVHKTQIPLNPMKHLIKRYELIIESCQIIENMLPYDIDILVPELYSALSAPTEYSPKESAQIHKSLSFDHLDLEEIQEEENEGHFHISRSISDSTAQLIRSTSKPQFLPSNLRKSLNLTDSFKLEKESPLDTGLGYNKLDFVGYRRHLPIKSGSIVHLETYMKRARILFRNYCSHEIQFRNENVTSSLTFEIMTESIQEKLSQFLGLDPESKLTGLPKSLTISVEISRKTTQPSKEKTGVIKRYLASSQIVCNIYVDKWVVNWLDYPILFSRSDGRYVQCFGGKSCCLVSQDLANTGLHLVLRKNNLKMIHGYDMYPTNPRRRALFRLTSPQHLISDKFMVPDLTFSPCSIKDNREFPNLHYLVATSISPTPFFRTVVIEILPQVTITNHFDLDIWIREYMTGKTVKSAVKRRGIMSKIYTMVNLFVHKMHINKLILDSRNYKRTRKKGKADRRDRRSRKTHKSSALGVSDYTAGCWIKIDSGMTVEFHPQNKGEFHVQVTGINPIHFTKSSVTKFWSSPLLIKPSSSTQFRYPQTIHKYALNVATPNPAPPSNKIESNMVKYGLCELETLVHKGCKMVRFSSPTKPEWVIINSTGLNLYIQQLGILSHGEILYPTHDLTHSHKTQRETNKESPEPEIQTGAEYSWYDPLKEQKLVIKLYHIQYKTNDIIGRIIKNNTGNANINSIGDVGNGLHFGYGIGGEMEKVSVKVKGVLLVDLGKVESINMSGIFNIRLGKMRLTAKLNAQTSVIMGQRALIITCGKLNKLIKRNKKVLDIYKQIKIPNVEIKFNPRQYLLEMFKYNLKHTQNQRGIRVSNRITTNTYPLSGRVTSRSTSRTISRIGTGRFAPSKLSTQIKPDPNTVVALNSDSKSNALGPESKTNTIGSETKSIRTLYLHNKSTGRSGYSTRGSGQRHTYPLASPIYNTNYPQKQVLINISKDYTLNVSLNGFGLCICSYLPEELLYLSLVLVKFSTCFQDNETRNLFSIGWLQSDVHDIDSFYPTMLKPVLNYSIFNIGSINRKKASSYVHHNIITNNNKEVISIVMNTKSNKYIKEISLLSIDIQPININLDTRLIFSALLLLDEYLSIFSQSERNMESFSGPLVGIFNYDNMESFDDDVYKLSEVVMSQYGSDSSKGSRYNISRFLIGKIIMVINLRRSDTILIDELPPLSPMVRYLVYILKRTPHISDAHIVLNKESLMRLCCTPYVLMSHFTTRYMTQIIHQIYKVLWAVDLIGNPKLIFNHWFSALYQSLIDFREALRFIHLPPVTFLLLLKGVSQFGVTFISGIVDALYRLTGSWSLILNTMALNSDRYAVFILNQVFPKNLSHPTNLIEGFFFGSSTMGRNLYISLGICVYSILVTPLPINYLNLNKLSNYLFHD